MALSSKKPSRMNLEYLEAQVAKADAALRAWLSENEEERRRLNKEANDLFTHVHSVRAEADNVVKVKLIERDVILPNGTPSPSVIARVEKTLGISYANKNLIKKRGRYSDNLFDAVVRQVVDEERRAVQRIDEVAVLFAAEKAALLRYHEAYGTVQPLDRERAILDRELREAIEERDAFAARQEARRNRREVEKNLNSKGLSSGGVAAAKARAEQVLRGFLKVA